MSKPKRHHYLPQFYLEGFSYDGRLVVFDEPRNRVRVESSLNTAVRGHYYSFVDATGSKVAEVESDLARIESRAKPVFQALSARQALSLQERYYLAVFLGFLACRTPAFERSINETITGRAEVVLRKNLEQPNADELFGTPPAELTALLDSGQFALETHPNDRISQMIDRAPELGKDFFVSDWTVLHTDERNAFVTSDSPFAIVYPDPVPEDAGFQRYGIASPEVITSFPLSSRECLLMAGARGTLTHSPATKGQVRRINLATVVEAEGLVVARDEAHLRSLVRRGGLGPGRQRPRLSVEEFPHRSGDPARSILATGRKRGSRE